MKGFLNNWIFSFGLVIALTIVSFAGTYSSDFEDYLANNQSEDMIGAVITMADRVDIASLKAELYSRKADRRKWHEDVVKALQEKATYTQASILEQLDYFKNQG